MYHIVRILVLFGFFTGVMSLVSCQDGNTIYIQYEDLPVGTQVIRLNRSLNGKHEPEPRYYTENLNLGKIGLRLPPGASGILEADIDAANGTMCVLGKATGTLPLGAGRDTMTVRFTPLAVSECPIEDLGSFADMSVPPRAADMSLVDMNFVDMSLSVADMPCVPNCSGSQFCINGKCNNCDWRITTPHACTMCISGNPFNAQNNNGTQICQNGNLSMCNVANFTNLLIKPTDLRWSHDCGFLYSKAFGWWQVSKPPGCYVMRGPTQTLPAGLYVIKVNGAIETEFYQKIRSSVDIVVDVFDSTSSQILDSYRQSFIIDGPYYSTLFEMLNAISIDYSCHNLEIRAYAKSTSGVPVVTLENVLIERK